MEKQRWMEYYPAFKRKAVLSHATPWMNLEDMMLSKKQASHKKTNSV